MKILVVGGGSGGHITPAVAVVREILSQKPRANIEFWTDFNEEDGSIKVNKIPYQYVVEMVCDWVGAGKVYSKDSWTQLSPITYYTKVRPGRHFHPDTEKLILIFLNTIAMDGLDEFHRVAKSIYTRVNYNLGNL